MYLVPSNSTGNELPNAEIIGRIAASGCAALRLLMRHCNHTLYCTARRQNSKKVYVRRNGLFGTL